MIGDLYQIIIASQNNCCNSSDNRYCFKFFQYCSSTNFRPIEFNCQRTKWDFPYYPRI